jgi:branched-chain amino acid transport system permease protein
MLGKTLRYAGYAAAVAVILALTGIFSAFEARFVIRGGPTLSTVVLVLMLGSGAWLSGAQARKLGSSVLLSSALGSLVVGLALAATVIVEANVDLRFVFPSLRNPIGGYLTFQQELLPGLIILLGISLVVGGAIALLLALPNRPRQVVMLALAITIVLGLLDNQIRNVIALADALVLGVVFACGYVGAKLARREHYWARLLVGAAFGALIGAAIVLLIGVNVLQPAGLVRGFGGPPLILGIEPALLLVPVYALIGAIGGLTVRSPLPFHNNMIYFFIGILILGTLNAQNGMTLPVAVFTFALLFAAFWLIPARGVVSDAAYRAVSFTDRRVEQGLAFLAALLLLLVLPLFAGQYITNVLNLAGLYIIMGIGLNIVVGFAGLLDLGYVAFFAIGAYSIGLLTTPSMLTCGGVPPRAITPENFAEVCTGILPFWQAWPLTVLISAIGGVMLGTPVLRLRGDYLAIVTLGFGEIIRIIVRFDEFRDLFGAAQGIQNIPRPVIDLSALNPTWRFELTGELGMYYLIIFGILLAAAIALRLSSARLGRAWRAVRADEDAAQAVGVKLIRTKLLAFVLGASFAGMAGAISATRLYGAYPDSFTILVSINVLSVVIIGGLGSVPGVIVGALVLVGLPEALRELSDYRLLAFGSLLVAAMVLKPRGLIPPPIRRFAEEARERGLVVGASEVK